MKTRLDLTKLEWTLSGSTPYLWRLLKSMEIGAEPTLEVNPVPAKVPGSVQQALLNAGIIKDWNIGTNSRDCEWVENRHWIFTAQLPDEWLGATGGYRLRCAGLDYSGWIYVNGHEAGVFEGSFVEHAFDITPYLRDSGNVLAIVFDLPPRWLGQFYYTSQVTQWKPRFNYTWDWIPRLLQIGIWSGIDIEVIDGGEIVDFHCVASTDESGMGSLVLAGKVLADCDCGVRLSLIGNDQVIRTEEVGVDQFQKGCSWTGLPIDPWWPNREGSQSLYDMECVLLNANGELLDRITRRIGFKSVEWKSCEGAPEYVDPWLCVVNGRPIFLAGVNWAPIRPNFADLTEEDYRGRLTTYRDLGFNVIRIPGCGFAEHDWLYDICDELGILVWQDFPLSCSGIENWPPEDGRAISEMTDIARHYVRRLRNHPSLLMWCGGNELQGDPDGSKTGVGKPVDLSHPMIAALKAVVDELDPQHRFMPASASGPCSKGDDITLRGKWMHWDVHGPYFCFATPEECEKYWDKDDALFRSEACAPGASSVEIIRRYAGNCDAFPADLSNPYWSRPTDWWNEWDKFVEDHGREPMDLEEYVDWSQQRQAANLAIAFRSRKERFPKNGGIIIWGSHDTFPLPANASILDFHGNPKPAARAIAEVLLNNERKQ